MGSLLLVFLYVFLVLFFCVFKKILFYFSLVKLIYIFPFYRETASIDLIRQIVQFHPQLVDYEANKLAIFEKIWHPGKTSRGMYSIEQIIIYRFVYNEL